MEGICISPEKGQFIKFSLSFWYVNVTYSFIPQICSSSQVRATSNHVCSCYILIWKWKGTFYWTGEDDKVCTCYQDLLSSSRSALCLLDTEVLVSVHCVPLVSIYVSKTWGQYLTKRNVSDGSFQTLHYLDGGKIYRSLGLLAHSAGLIGTKPEGRVLEWTHYFSDVVWAADHSRLQESWVLSEGTFHFNGPNLVAGREKQTLPSSPHSYEASKGEWKRRQLDLEEFVMLLFLPMNQS